MLLVPVYNSEYLNIETGFEVWVLGEDGILFCIYLAE